MLTPRQQAGVQRRATGVIRRRLGSGAGEGGDPLRSGSIRPTVNSGPPAADYSNGFSLSVALGNMCLGTRQVRAGIKGTP